MSPLHRRRAVLLTVLAVVFQAPLGSCVRESGGRPAVTITGRIHVSQDGRYLAFFTCLNDRSGSLVGNQMVVLDLKERSTAYFSESTDVLDRPLVWHPQAGVLLVNRHVWWHPELGGLFAWAVDKQGFREIATPALDFVDGAWSPDGTELVCLGLPRASGPVDRALFRVDFESGRATEIPGTARAQLMALRPWQGEGYLIFLRYAHPRQDGYDWTVSVVRSVTDRLEEVVPVDWHVAMLDDVSADGEKLAMRRRSGEDSPRELLVYEWQRGGGPTVIAGPPDTIVSSTWSPSGDRLLCVGRNSLWLWHTGTERLLRLPFEEWQHEYGRPPIAWLPGGDAFVLGVGPQLLRIDPKDGSSSLVVDLSAPRATGP